MRRWRGQVGNGEEALVLIDRVSWLSDPRLYDEAWSRLPQLRRKKADSLRFERDRRLSVGAWLLLEQAFRMEGLCLGDYPVRLSDRGKPYAVGCPLHFSISHSGEYAMCAVSRGEEVGCDIQQLDACDAGVAQVCMTPGELREIKALPSSSQRAHAICRHWVAKESYLKALGCGLAKAPASFAVAFCEDGGLGSLGSARIADNGFAGTVDAFEVPAPEGYHAAACVLGSQG